MDQESARQALHRALDSDLPVAIDQLDADKLEQLAELIEHARERQQAQMRQSLEDALAYVPSLARGTVRRILFPKDGDA